MKRKVGTRCYTAPWRGGPMQLRVCKSYEDGVVRRITARVYDGTRHAVAQVEAFRGGGARTKNKLVIGHADVEPLAHRRKGWGTELYERVLRSACGEGVTITSGTTRSEFAEAFWRKQVRKGRARCERAMDARTPATYYRMPKAELRETVSEAEYEAIMRKLPKPRRGADDEQVWACPRYVIKAGKCRSGDFSLKGLRR